METRRKITFDDLAAMMRGRIANEQEVPARLPSRAAGGLDLPPRPAREAFAEAFDVRLQAKQRENLIAKLRSALRQLLAENSRLKSEVARLREGLTQAQTSAQKVWRAASRKPEEPVVREPEPEVEAPVGEVIEGEVVEVEEPDPFGRGGDPYGSDDDGGLLG